MCISKKWIKEAPVSKLLEILARMMMLSHVNAAAKPDPDPV